jgi:hypothetical protein
MKQQPMGSITWPSSIMAACHDFETGRSEVLRRRSTASVTRNMERSSGIANTAVAAPEALDVEAELASSALAEPVDISAFFERAMVWKAADWDMERGPVWHAYCYVSSLFAPAVGECRRESVGIRSSVAVP